MTRIFSPPSLARWLIARTVQDEGQRQALLGDLDELYQLERSARPAWVADLWYWWEATVIALRYGPRRRRAAAPPISPAEQRYQGENPMQFLAQDFKYGLRMLTKNPVLSGIAALAIALGVGLTTHTFSVVQGSVLRGLPIENQGQLVHLERNNPSEGINSMGVPVHDFRDWQEQQTAFTDLAGFYQGTVNVSGPEGRPERFEGAFISVGGLAMIGVNPLMGRLFQPGEDEPGAEPVMIIGHSVWQNRFGGSSEVVGRTVRANGRVHTIVGVMPRKFKFPFNESVWIPLPLDHRTLERGQGIWLEVFGRLKQEVDLDQALVSMNSIAQRLATEYPETNEGVGVLVKPYAEEYMPAEITAVLWAMLGATFGVLLIACANVANLLLARASVRGKEVAIRTALGADRWRVITQLLVESLVIALVGGAIGLGISYVGVDLFNRAIVDIEKPFWIDIRVDPPVLLFALGVTILASLIAGIVPAFKASGAKANEILKEEGRAGTSLRLGRFTGALVIGQITLSCALLVAAGLMVKSVVKIKNIDLGFQTENVITARVGLFETDYPETEDRRNFWNQLRTRLSERAGIEATALSSSLPGAGAGRWRFAVEGESYETERDYPNANRYVITPGFFETYGVSLREGRSFDPADREDALEVAVVNESFAAKHFPGQSALGRRIRVGGPESENPWLTIVGVVPDMYVGGFGAGGIGSAEVIPDAFYTPLAQDDRRFLWIIARTRGDPSQAVPLIRDQVSSIDSNLPIYWVRTMEESMENATWAFSLFGSLFTIFGAVALFMAGVGLYGVMAFSVTRRTQEMGIRMALGAHGKNLVGLVLKKGLFQLAVGVTLGLGLGFLLSGPVQSVTYGVERTDPVVFLSIILTMGASGLLALILPARRATRVDPVIALRAE